MSSFFSSFVRPLQTAFLLIIFRSLNSVKAAATDLPIRFSSRTSLTSVLFDITMSYSICFDTSSSFGNSYALSSYSSKLTSLVLPKVDETPFIHL